MKVSFWHLLLCLFHTLLNEHCHAMNAHFSQITSAFQNVLRHFAWLLNKHILAQRRILHSSLRFRCAHSSSPMLKAQVLNQKKKAQKGSRKWQLAYFLSENQNRLRLKQELCLFKFSFPLCSLNTGNLIVNGDLCLLQEVDLKLYDCLL